MQKTEIVYNYFSIEKLYCVLVWKIIVDQIPLDELIVLSKQLMKYSSDEASKLGIEVWFNEDNSVVIFPDGDTVNILCFAQCENNQKTIDKLKEKGIQQKSFNDYNESN